MMRQKQFALVAYRFRGFSEAIGQFVGHVPEQVYRERAAHREAFKIRRAYDQEPAGLERFDGRASRLTVYKAHLAK